MPRNRMIKPQFWCSEQVVSCSRDARLLFIGLLNFSDDNGAHQASAPRLKMEVFPGDACSVEDVKKWITELIDSGLICEYAVNGKFYWLVTGFSKHQRIDRPTPSTLPLPESALKMINDSTSPRRPLALKGREGKGKEEKEKEEDIVVSDADSLTPKPSQNCPQEEIKALYHEILPMCRQVRVWNEARIRLLRGRWKESEKHQSLDFWRWYFGYVKESKFLTGQVAGRDGRPPFSADLEWLIKPINFAKVIEGKFHEQA